MKTLLLTMLFALSALAAGETLDSDCHDACVARETITFTGTGYSSLSGNSEYGFWLRGVMTNGQPVEYLAGGVTVADGVYTASASFLAGSYQACSIIAKRNKPLTILACASFTVN